MRYFIVWGFTAGSFELTASDKADALLQIQLIEWNMACAYGNNPCDCGVSHEVFK